MSYLCKVTNNDRREDEKGVHYVVKMKQQSGTRGELDYDVCTVTLKCGTKRDADRFPVDSHVNVRVDSTQTNLGDYQP